MIDSTVDVIVTAWEASEAFTTSLVIVVVVPATVLGVVLHTGIVVDVVDLKNLVVVMPDNDELEVVECLPLVSCVSHWLSRIQSVDSCPHTQLGSPGNGLLLQHLPRHGQGHCGSVCGVLVVVLSSSSVELLSRV